MKIAATPYATWQPPLRHDKKEGGIPPPPTLHPTIHPRKICLYTVSILHIGWEWGGELGRSPGSGSGGEEPAEIGE